MRGILEKTTFLSFEYVNSHPLTIYFPVRILKSHRYSLSKEFDKMNEVLWEKCPIHSIISMCEISWSQPCWAGTTYLTQSYTQKSSEVITGHLFVASDTRFTASEAHMENRNNVTELVLGLTQNPEMQSSICPILLIYIATVLGNVLIMVTIAASRSWFPCIFLASLSFIDPVYSTTVTLK